MLTSGLIFQFGTTVRCSSLSQIALEIICATLVTLGSAAQMVLKVTHTPTRALSRTKPESALLLSQDTRVPTRPASHLHITLQS